MTDSQAIGGREREILTALTFVGVGITLEVEVEVAEIGPGEPQQALVLYLKPVDLK